MNVVTTEETRKSSESPPPTSFSSLPYDIVVNILARISRIHRPTLSLVSKSFQSLLASRELQATRTLIRKTENYIYLCLNFQENPKPTWFILAPTPKLIPIPSFPYEHPLSPRLAFVDSEIYLIGGFVKRKRSRKVSLLDCGTHQWHRIPRMRVPRGRPAAADVIDGKIYVIGGCRSNKSEDWGEVYDPKTRTWETLSPETLDLTTQKSVVPGSLVMGGKVYAKNGLLVEIENNVFCQILVDKGKLMWNYAYEDLGLSMVTGLARLSLKSFGPKHFVSMVSSCGGRRVRLWWKKVVSPCKGRHDTNEAKTTEIWCAEISFKRRGFKELLGFLEWSKGVFTFDGSDCGVNSLLHSVIITH